jgi:hypothetical protein
MSGEKSRVTETRYTPEFAEKVCERMAEGASLREVCRDNGMPESSVRQWVRDDRDGFAARYQAARALQVESWSDQIIEIGNRQDLDPQDKRVRCDNLKWLMSKLLPKRYGDRLLVAGDAENPLQVLHQQVSLVDLTNDQLDALDKFTRSLSEAWPRNFPEIADALQPCADVPLVDHITGVEGGRSGAPHGAWTAGSWRACGVSARQCRSRCQPATGACTYPGDAEARIS